MEENAAETHCEPSCLWHLPAWRRAMPEQEPSFGLSSRCTLKSNVMPLYLLKEETGGENLTTVLVGGRRSW